MQGTAVGFARHYADNSEIKTNNRTLEVMVQKDKQRFTEFLNRWRKESVKLYEKLAEWVMVDKFINNLRPAYANILRYQSFRTFKYLIVVGNRIEDDFRRTEIDNAKG